MQSLTGDERTEAIKNAQSDGEYQKIADALSAEGFAPQKNNVSCKLTTYPEKENHRTVVVPFEKTTDDPESENAHILWMEKEFGKHSVLGFRFEWTTDSLSSSSSPSADHSERYFVESGEVQTKESDYHNVGDDDFDTEAHLPGGGGGGGSCGDLCKASATVCDSNNYQCWSTVAGAYGGAFIACSKCVGSFFDDAICGGCIFAVLAAYGVDCNLGNGCTTETGCYECSEYPNIT